jgi:hypothetical protein
MVTVLPHNELMPLGFLDSYAGKRGCIIAVTSGAALVLFEDGLDAWIPDSRLSYADTEKETVRPPSMKAAA